MQIFDGETDQNHEREKFCGSIAESFTSKTNVLYVRFFAEVQGIESRFRAVATTFTPTTEEHPCDPEVYFDCEDTNCISNTLLCNGVRNCKFGWDEEGQCQSEDEGEAVLDMSSPHVVVVCVVLILIVFGMCAVCFWHLRRLIAEDKEELAASKASINEVGVSALVTGEPGSKPGQIVLPGDPDNMMLRTSSTVRLKKAGSASLSQTHPMDNNGGCYVPDTGFPLNTRL